MDDQESRELWKMVRQQGETVTRVAGALAQVLEIREADKLVIQQLGATVEIFDARIAMLSAKVDELEARLNGN